MSGTAEALKGHAAMLLFAVVISGSFTLGKAGSPYLDPGALTALRFVFAVSAMAFVAAFVDRSSLRIRVGTAWRFLILGGLLGVYFVMMFEALRFSDPVSLAAIFTIAPILTTVFARILLGQQPTALVVASLALAGSGALWVIFRGDLDALLGFDLGFGEWLFAAGSVAHALYVPLVKVFDRGEGATVVAFWTMAGGLAVTGLYALPAVVSVDWTAVPAIAWLTAVYLGLFASAGTFLLIRYATRRIPAAKVMAYGYLTPSLVVLEEGLAGNGWAPLPVLAGVAITVAAMLALVCGRDA